MGCTISAPDQFFVDTGNSISFSCSQGHTLLNAGQVVQGGVFPFSCSGDRNVDFSSLTCAADSPEPITLAPVVDPRSPDTAGTTVVVKTEEPTYVDCPIPKVDGLVAYQAASDVAQASILPHPVSILNGTQVYNVHPHDSIIFFCEESSQAMSYGGMALEENGNSYAFHCLAREGSAEAEADGVEPAAREVAADELELGPLAAVEQDAPPLAADERAGEVAGLGGERGAGPERDDVEHGG